MKYKLIVEVSKDYLELEVNRFLSAGWTLIGQLIALPDGMGGILYIREMIQQGSPDDHIN